RILQRHQQSGREPAVHKAIGATRCRHRRGSRRQQPVTTLDDLRTRGGNVLRDGGRRGQPSGPVSGGKERYLSGRYGMKLPEEATKFLADALPRSGFRIEAYAEKFVAQQRGCGNHRPCSDIRPDKLGYRCDRHLRGWYCMRETPQLCGTEVVARADFLLEPSIPSPITRTATC